MQIAKAYVLSLVDDDGIGIRDVQSVLYDGGTEKKVVISGHKIQNFVFQLLGFHLSVGYADFHIGHEAVQNVINGLQFLHPVVKEKYLSSPVELVVYDFSNFIRVEKHNLSLDRYAVRRRCGYYGQVTGSEKRKLQSPRYRCSSKSQSVHGFLELTQFLLCAHTEFLLLIDYQQPKVPEFETCTEYLVSTYQYIYGPALEFLLDFSQFLCTAKTAHKIYIAWKILQTGSESLVMLQGKNGCRHKNSHLFAVRSRFERSPYGHFRLSEAHISAYQTIHRAFRFHIPLDGLHSLFLIRSVFVYE